MRKTPEPKPQPEVLEHSAEVKRMLVASSDLALASLLSSFATQMGMSEREAVKTAMEFVPEFRRFIAENG